MKKTNSNMSVYVITYILRDEAVYCDRRPTKNELRKIVKKEFGWDDERLEDELVDMCLDIRKVKVQILDEI